MTALAIQDLVKTYKNGVKALKGVSFEVEEGDFFALLGPNGAGKSTLINILDSLVIKTGGKAVINGYDIDNQFSAAKSTIGVVPQEFNFSQFAPVYETLMNQAGYYGLPPKIARERTEKYLHEVRLWDKRKHVTRTLSGGMKRRMMIARAMLHEPKMLILDEPTAGVDIEIRRSMWEYLSYLNDQGTTIILTTHYLEEAENLCRNIAIIDHGELVMNTSMSKVLKQLERERFILYLSEPLSSIPSIEGYRFYTVDDLTVEVEVHRDLGITPLFHVLHDMNIHVSSMRNKRNRLEELFVSLTTNTGNSAS